MLANRYVGVVSVFLGSCTNVNAQEVFTVLSLEICWFIKHEMGVLDDEAV